jgi:hypothetical protein
MSSPSYPSPTHQMRRAVVAIVIAGALAGGVAACSTGQLQGDSAAAAPINAASAANAKAHHATLSFVATDIEGNNVTVDLGEKSPDGPDIGDLVAFTQNLTEDGKDAGQVHVMAIGVDHEKHLSEATGTIVLKNGSIQLAGVVAMEPTFTLSVVGGTGDYTGATGTMAFDASGNDQTMKVELR